MRNGNQFVKDKVKQTALHAERGAKRNITTNRSVVTGYMRNSVQSILGDNEAIVSANAEYSAYVEFGTIYRSPKPYFFPAVVEAKAWLISEMRRGGIL
jgi:HK97 gp10 family phage protein